LEFLAEVELRGAPILPCHLGFVSRRHDLHTTIKAAFPSYSKVKFPDIIGGDYEYQSRLLVESRKLWQHGCGEKARKWLGL
jgi:hypothetical protein